MIRKKICSALLAVILAVSLPACGHGKDADSGDSPAQSGSEQTTQTAAGGTAAGETEEQAAGKGEAAAESAGEESGTGEKQEIPEAPVVRDDGGVSMDIFAMDTYMNLLAYGDNAEEAVLAAAEEIHRLDALLSTGSAESEISRLNAAGGGEISDTVEELITRSQELRQETGGLFEIGIYPVMKLWGFPTQQYRVPEKTEIEEALKLADASQITISEAPAGTPAPAAEPAPAPAAEPAPAPAAEPAPSPAEGTQTEPAVNDPQGTPAEPAPENPSDGTWPDAAEAAPASGDAAAEAGNANAAAAEAGNAPAADETAEVEAPSTVETQAPAPKTVAVKTAQPQIRFAEAEQPKTDTAEAAPGAAEAAAPAAAETPGKTEAAPAPAETAGQTEAAEAAPAPTETTPEAGKAAPETAAAPAAESASEAAAPAADAAESAPGAAAPAADAAESAPRAAAPAAESAPGAAAPAAESAPETAEQAGETVKTAAFGIPGMEIDLGGIAKGYTSSRVIEIFREHGIKHGLVSLGGNVQTLGSKEGGKPWRVAIQDPESEMEYLGVLEIEDKCVITSGGYERFFEQDGVRYHHIIDPRTGYPADSGLLSATIVSEDGTLADGLSTSLFIMGKEEAEKYWRAHPGTFDYILEDKDGVLYVTEGAAELLTTDNKTEVIR